MINNQAKQWEWADVRKEVSKGNFIGIVMNFDTEVIKPETKSNIKKMYLDTADWDLQRIFKASQAAGPLGAWFLYNFLYYFTLLNLIKRVESQLKYADILKKVDPLRNEVKSLQMEETLLIAKMDQTTKFVLQLQENIQQYQTEYETLKEQSNTIKIDMKKVETKVNRSMSLIENLSSERYRWTNSSKNFQY